MERIVCKKCGNSIPSTSAFCPCCGSNVSIVCPQCGSEMSYDALYCGNCGTSLSKQSSDCNHPKVQKVSPDENQNIGIIIGVIVLIFLLIVTVPNERRHKEVLMDKMTEMFCEDKPEANYDAVNGFVRMFGSRIYDTRTDYSNMGIFSFVTLKTSEFNRRLVSFGILGYVYTPSISELREEWKKLKLTN